MWTYQVRPRHFIARGGGFSFPTEVTLRVILEPLQPFGVELDQSRTARHETATSLLFNANTGTFWVEPAELFDPLDLDFEDRDGFQVSVTGNEIAVTFTCEEPETLEHVARTLFFGVPVMLNLEFEDPPYPIRVEGVAGDARLSWELPKWKAGIGVSNKELQEEKVRRAWRYQDLIAEVANRRLLASARYFYTACRLERAGNSPWEFMGEIILNLCKVLEVLFPGEAGQESMDAARAGLAELGVDEADRERDFIPVLALRNHIDSGHVLLSVFDPEDLAVLHQFCEDVLRKFRELLGTVFEKVDGGEWSPAPYSDPTPRDDALEIIDRMRANQPRE